MGSPRQPLSRRAPTPRAPRRWGSLAAVVGLYVVLLVAIGAALVTFRYRPALEDAQALRSEIAAVGSRLQAIGPDMNRTTLGELRQDVANARARLDRLTDLIANDPVVAVARALPPTAANVLGADGIVSAAKDTFDAIEAGLSIGDRYVAIKEEQAADPEEASSLALLVELMATTREAATSASASLRNAEETLASVPVGLAGPIDNARQEMVARLSTYAPLVDTYVELSADLPEILGWDGQRRYLVLAQNPAELRATGGFIGSYGLVSFDRGRVTERTFQDVYLLDDPVDYPYVEPPPELETHILRPGLSWTLRDANWSPDFPTAAQDALRLYENQSGDTTIDGVLGITTETIDEILTITGPMSVPEYAVTISAGETTLKTLQLTRTSDDPDENRKAFLSALADELIPTLLELPTDRWGDLLGASSTFQERRLLLAWFANPDHQRLAAKHGFDGAVRDDAGDYVFPVDSNVRPFSKLSAMTTRALDLDVELDLDGQAHSTLQINWENRILLPEGEPFRQLQGVGPTRILGMYFRLILPESSRVEAVAGGNPTPITAPEPLGPVAGRTAIGNYLQVPPGATSLRYSWVSPEAVAIDGTGGVYRLTIQKQPGLSAGPIKLTIRVPEGSRITTTGGALTVSGQVATLETTFDRDISVGLRYER